MKQRKESTWLIPVMVVMVVAATIYISVIETKIEYVYSLATACFGYYFGYATQKPPQPPENGSGREQPPIEPPEI